MEDALSRLDELKKENQTYRERVKQKQGQLDLYQDMVRTTAEAKLPPNEYDKMYGSKNT